MSLLDSKTFDPTPRRGSDTAARLWHLLTAVTAGHAAQCGVPVETLTGRKVLAESGRPPLSPRV